MRAFEFIRRVQLDDVDRLVTFETENAAYFERFVSRRPEPFFTAVGMSGLVETLVSDMEAGGCAYLIALDAKGAVLGRVNFMRAGDGIVDLGYRVAANAAGRGLATAMVRYCIDVVAKELSLSRITARANSDNLASTAVLVRSGFVPTGETDVVDFHGEPMVLQKFVLLV